MADTFELNGRTFAMKIENDDCQLPPWENEDGHGPVSEWTSRAKQPGEMILCSDGRKRRLYDFSSAVVLAKRDGWGGEGKTAGERAHRAALADFDRLRRWCDDQWNYVGVVVAPVCSCCDEAKWDKAQSLWGIESDAGEYLQEVARELAAEFE